MSGAHTPGPWKVEGFMDGNPCIADSRGATLGFARGAYAVPRSYMDNANLMAAAPELLASLREVLALLPSTDAPGAVQQRALAAIAKAQGKS